MSKPIKLINDAPYNGINFYTISFIDPDNYKDAEDIPEAQHLQVRGFIVYGGYNLETQASDHIRQIKEDETRHDITIGEVGKIYQWNDRENAEKMEYGRKELNDMEISRRENVEKQKVVLEQVKHDYAKYNKTEQIDKMKDHLRKVALQRGIITTDDYEKKMKNGKNITPKKQLIGDDYLKMIKNINDQSNNDYLFERPVDTFEWGCVSFYDPSIHKGLVKFCIKLRGLSETEEQIDQRIKDLKKLYPNDNISKFPVGKWCAIPIAIKNLLGSTSDSNLMPDLGKQLNYMMYLHNNHIEIEKTQFEERKKKLVREARREQQSVKKNQATAEPTPEKPKKKSMFERLDGDDDMPVFDSKDKSDIDELASYLEDVGVKGFTIDSKKMEVTDSMKS